MSVISEEIKDWEDRVYFGNLKFKEETMDPSSPYYAIIKDFSNSFMDGKFRIIACEYESQTYKIPRLLIEKFGFVNDDFTFDTGTNLEVYLGSKGVTESTLQERVEEYLDVNRKDFKNKIVIIPLIDFNFEKSTAIYLADRMEVRGVKGLIFSYEKNNFGSLMHTLALNSYNKMIQFPQQLVQSTRGRRIEDDGL